MSDTSIICSQPCSLTSLFIIPTVRLDPDKSEMTVLNFRIAYLAVLLLNENPSSTPLDPLEPNSESGLDNHRKKANGYVHISLITSCLF